MSDLFHDQPTKRCRGCDLHKPLSEFHHIRNANGKRYPYSYCKPCATKNRGRWHFTPAGQKAHRRRGLKVCYGMTPEEYDQLHKAQGGLCAICGQPEVCMNRRGTLRPLAVDHDHATGAIRGLLCQHCNQGIGRFRDDPRLLRLAALYLENYAPRPQT